MHARWQNRIVWHGHAKRGQHSPTYKAWRSMLTRCYDKGSTMYRYYGGRGIGVCRRWRESFLAFLHDVGEKPSALHSLDRIRRHRQYGPGNVRWATDTEQARNHPNAHMLRFNGQRRCIAEWAEVTGISRYTIATRLQWGWSVADALTTTPRRLSYHVRKY